jgi:hypothetical protein
MSVEVERFATPTTAAQVRMLERVRRRTAARLAGRRVLVMPTLTSGADVAGTLATKELDPGISAQRRQLGWASALADAVSADRRDSVGGTLHARPNVAAR